MEDLFFRSHWAQPTARPRYASSFRGIPVQSARPPVQHPKPPANTTATAPKVVQIPVHFVRSEPSRSASALKIQKVFRGFLVRRSVKRIMSIRREVDEIERRISRSEEVELIRRDERERLRVNETLMALVFKLDSVRGIDSGVRECRRAVIKKAIALQERVDAIVSSASDQIDTQSLVVELEDEGSAGTADSIPGSASQDPVEIGNPIIHSAVSDTDNRSDQNWESKSAAGEIEECPSKPLNEVKLSENETEVENMDAENCEDEEVGADFQVNAEEENCYEDKAIDRCHDGLEVQADLGMKDKEEERCVDREINEFSYKTPDMSECVEESMDTIRIKNVNEESMGEMGGKEKEGTDDSKRNRELLERMMEDNEKMMNLITQLCQRNEMQMRMLNGLTHRVEQLEKAFICDRMRRRKKMHSS